MDDNQRNRLRRMRSQKPTPFKNETYLLIPYLLELEAMIAAATEAYVAKPHLMGMDQFTFEQKIRIAASLGVLDEEYFGGCLALNRLRNKIAHRVGYHLTKKDVGAIRSRLPRYVTEAAEAALAKIEEGAAGTTDELMHRVTFLQWVCVNFVGRIGEVGNIFYGMKGKIDEMSYAYLHYILARRDLRERPATPPWESARAATVFATPP